LDSILFLSLICFSMTGFTVPVCIVEKYYKCESVHYAP
jgi:hypothetical protein